MIKSLEPYQKKLGTDTWYYAKRCFLSLIENMAKHMLMMKDAFLNECVQFLEACECKYYTIQLSIITSISFIKLETPRNDICMKTIGVTVYQARRRESRHL